MNGRGGVIDDSVATDGELLARFAAARDEAAFGELLRRHGALVFGVCRRRLPQAADAEDALQATFLALARQARGMADRGTVAPWLHCVAARISGKLRRQAARRREAPLPEAVLDGKRSGDFLLGERLDRELARLPERERAAVLLCGVEGMARREAARLVGVPEGTFSARLSRGYARLRQRLGNLDPAAALGSAAFALPSDVQAATMDIARDRVGTAIPAAILRLAKGATAMDGLRRVGMWAAAGVAALGMGAAALLAQDGAGKTTVDPLTPEAAAKAALDPSHIVDLQAKLAALDAERTVTAAKLAELNKAANAAFLADPNFVIVQVVRRTQNSEDIYMVQMLHRKQLHQLIAHNLQSLEYLAGLMTKATPKPRYIGFRVIDASAEQEMAAARAVFRKTGFAVIDLDNGREPRDRDVSGPVAPRGYGKATANTKGSGNPYGYRIKGTDPPGPDRGNRKIDDEARDGLPPPPQLK